LAGFPTIRSPDFPNATTEGKSLSPSGVKIILELLPSRYAATELVVPKSIPIIIPIWLPSVNHFDFYHK
jgi:hypothetical protein